jgi:beta-lactamase class A
MILNLRKNKEESQEIKNSGKSNGNEEKTVKNPRKKKEQAKPWGKKERIIVFLLIVITVGTSAVLALSSRSWKLPGIPRIQLPSVSIFQEETIFIEKENEVGGSSDKVIYDFEDKTKGLSGVWGLYVIDLKSGKKMGVYENEIFDAASLVKLPVMAAMLQEAEFENLDLDEEYILKETDKTPGSGILYHKPVGYVVTYGELVELMGKKSDNTAFTISKNLLGEEKINKVQGQYGMTSTSIKDNSTTPVDVASFFEKLYNNEILTKGNSEKIIEYLTDTAYEEWLTAGVPEDIVVSHKYGALPSVVNDAGIVYAQKPYVVVIVSKGVVSKEADKVFPELSRSIYKNLQNTN